MINRIVVSLVLVMCSFCVYGTNENGQIAVDTSYMITIGGIQQYVKIKGDDEQNPLLLYLHGGPGQSVMSKADALTSDLQKHFLVVHWDQRGAGETLNFNSEDQTLSIDQMKQDAEEVVQYLLSTYSIDKIVIVGHSWGTVLGFHLANALPDHIAAYIAISPVINSLQSQEIALRKLKAYYKEKDNEKALAQLATVSVPPDNLEQMIIQYRWQTSFDGEEVTDEQVEQAMPFFTQWEARWGAIEKEIVKINMFEELKSLSCPVYFFIGSNDYQTNFTVAQDYFELLKAPTKKLFWFKESAHNVPDTQGTLMQDIIINEILPTL